MEHFTLIFTFMDDSGQVNLKLEAWSIRQLSTDLIRSIYKYNLERLGYLEEFNDLRRKLKI